MSSISTTALSTFNTWIELFVCFVLLSKQLVWLSRQPVRRVLTDLSARRSVFARTIQPVIIHLVIVIVYPDFKERFVKKVYLIEYLVVLLKWLRKLCLGCLLGSTLTPVPPVTARDETWPFFHFWRHHFWPKLALSILNFCRRKRSFQWCPDQSDRPNGVLHMHKNVQKVEWKTQSKISCHYTWLLHAKICPSRWRFLRSFLTASKPTRRSITATKRYEK